MSFSRATCSVDDEQGKGWATCIEGMSFRDVEWEGKAGVYEAGDYTSQHGVEDRTEACIADIFEGRHIKMITIVRKVSSDERVLLKQYTYQEWVNLICWM